MEGKLIKTSIDSYHNGHYFLNDSDGFAIGSTDKDWCKRAVSKRPLYILSLKNCETIENGYDLDDLADWYGIETEIKSGRKVNDEDFISGFETALQILGDKKFSLEDMKKVYLNSSKYEWFGDCIKSLQQTEWDVEIEMICPHPSDTYKCGIQYGCDEDGCNHPNQVPYLDAECCLILKRKV